MQCLCIGKMSEDVQRKSFLLINVKRLIKPICTQTVKVITVPGLINCAQNLSKFKNTLEISIKQKMSYAQAVKKLKETEEQKITHQQMTPSVSEETATETKPITNNLTVLKEKPSIKNMETQTDRQYAHMSGTIKREQRQQEVVVQRK